MKNKINVNISPNPLDLQTLHCSQNDTGERKFYFTLHNNGEVIDTTDISDPIFEPFDVYKGGTEQILPVNTGVPTTSPIIADIQYPDEEKTEQEFTYRESPTTIDGKALIEKIKGNTLKWNQLARPLASGYYDAINGTVSYTDGVARYEITTVADQNYNNRVTVRFSYYPNWELNHKYLFIITHRENRTGLNLAFSIAASSVGTFPSTSTDWVTSMALVNNTAISGNNWYRIGLTGSRQIDDWFEVKNAMIIDLTAMGLDVTASEFTSLFPLSYYTYNAGTLLNFNGNGIKTVGFNQWDEQWEVGALSVNNGSEIAVNTYMRSKFIPVISGKTYCRGINYKSDCIVFFYDGNHAYVGNVATSSANTLFTIPSGVSYIRFHKNGATYDNDICINISDSSKNGTYEPYTFSNLDIPTSTYFPTGMKSAGTVYDELTNSKAITRIGEVDLGTLIWERMETATSGAYRFRSFISDISSNPSDLTNGQRSECIYPLLLQGETYNANKIGYTISNKTVIFFIDGYKTYTEEQFKNAMDGVYLQYELEEEQVTEFTHASLICEDGESTLYQDDDSLACECTEDFSKDSGFKDCKIKITNDDGVVYSNKIQLHIERKP